MIAHEWAHGRDKKYARSNVFAESGTIYSYGRHFPMARAYSVAGGGRVVLFTSHGYSVSTARHLGYVRQAVRGQRIFVVDKVCSGYGGDLTKKEHKENHRKLLEDAARCVVKSKAERIRQSTRDKLISDAEHYRVTANEYRAAFKLGGKDCASVGVAAERIARAEKAEARRQVKAAEARRRAEAERFDEWKAGVGGGTFRDFPVCFRLKPETKGRVVQSSLGAEFTAASARAAWGRLKEIRAGLSPAGSYSPIAVDDVAGFEADKVLTISGFRVERVDGSGLVVGCHSVSWEAAEALAKLLGVK